ncbi:hypothetical protein [Nocardiopsis sp. NPDC006938]|uniref:hypothetical protein n=1 Tax=Nocardiopsis sp. NPDC006938 TaxID=3364337 RepID=UPI00369315CA
MMTFTFLMLTVIPIGLIAAAILLCRLPDEAGDLARLQQIRDRQQARQGGES